MSESLDLQTPTASLSDADDQDATDWWEEATSTYEFASYTRPSILDDVELFHGRFARHVFPRHAHPYHYCLSIVQEGALEIDLIDRHAVVEPGAIILVEPGQAHAGRSGDGRPYRARTTYFPVSVFAEFGLAKPHFPTILSDPKLFELIRTLHRDAENDERATSPELFSTILRRLSSYAVGDGGRQVHPAVHDAIHLIDHDDPETDEADLEDLAARVGLHPVYLSRLFTRTTGLPPHAYRTSVRLQHAKERLTGGDDIACVAADLGFTDQSHLSRLFKRNFGITPGAYSTGRLKTYNTTIS